MIASAGRIAGPVTEAEKLLAELHDAPLETTLPILVSGWGRGLVAGLEELASAVEAMPHPQADFLELAPPQRPRPHDEPRPRSEHSERRDLAELGEEQLTEEARRSPRRHTAAAKRRGPMATNERCRFYCPLGDFAGIDPELLEQRRVLLVIDLVRHLLDAC